MTVRHGLPLKAWNAFLVQRSNAKRRGVPFEFTPEEWWAWWQIDDRWPRRGLGLGKLVMARRGDVGPYSPANVYCATAEQNVADWMANAPPEKIRAARKAAHFRRLARGDQIGAKPGAEHPNARAVITPAGAFPTATAAAHHYGIARQTAAYKARICADGWCYEDASMSISERVAPVMLPHDYPRMPTLSTKLRILLSALIEAEDYCRIQSKNLSSWCKPTDIWIDATIRTSANFDALRVLGLVKAHPTKPRLWCSSMAGRREASNSGRVHLYGNDEISVRLRPQRRRQALA